MGLVNPAMPNVGSDPRGTGESTLRDSVTALLNEFNGNIESANVKDDSLTVNDLGRGANGPAVGCFSASRAAALSRLSGEVITFDTEAWDVSAWFDIAAGATQGRFVPQVAGYYRFNWGVGSNVTLTADVWWLSAIYKNGVLEKEGQIAFQRGATGVRSMGSAVVQMNGTTDFVDVRILHSVGATAAVTAAADRTFLQGELIGRS